MHTDRYRPTQEARRGVLARFVGCERGAAATIIVILVPVLIAFGVGLGAEVGLWYTVKRQMQSAADAAAMAGGYEQASRALHQELAAEPIETRLCNVGEKAAGFNGFTTSNCTAGTSSNGVTCPQPSGGPSTGMCVNSPPQVSGDPYAGNQKAVEAVLWRPLNTFSFFLPDVTVGVRAVAAWTYLPPPCIAALGPPKQGRGYGILISGGGTVNMTGCGLYSNLAGSNSIIIQGTSTTVNVDGIFATGGLNTPGNPTTSPSTLTETGYTFTDPFSCAPTDNPPYTTDTCAGYITFPKSPTLPDPPAVVAPTSTIFRPGYYEMSQSGPFNFPQGTYSFCPGLYMVNGSDSKAAFDVGSGVTVKMLSPNPTITDPNDPSKTVPDPYYDSTFSADCGTNNTADGVTIVGLTGGFNLQAGSVVELRAPSTSIDVSAVQNSDGTFQIGKGCTPVKDPPGSGGCIPKGLLFYTPKTVANSASNIADSLIIAGVDTSLDGAVYAPGNNVAINGNAGAQCTIVIAANVTINGSATLTGTGCYTSILPKTSGVALAE